MMNSNLKNRRGPGQRRQRGVSMLGILAICVIIVLVAVLALKVTPAYIEFGTVKTAMLASTGGKTVQDIQRAFQRNADINSISVISGKDLDITKEGNNIIVGFHYDKKIPLFANVSILIEFSADSNNP